MHTQAGKASILHFEGFGVILQAFHGASILNKHVYTQSYNDISELRN